MSIDELQVSEAVASVTDPELRRPLGELHMVGTVEARRKRVSVDLLLPVAHYPQVDELVARVRRAVGVLSGVDEVTIDTKTMDEADRARLRTLLRGESLPDGEAGHGHGGHGSHDGDRGAGTLGHEEGRPNRFMLPRSKTRVIGVSSARAGWGSRR